MNEIQSYMERIETISSTEVSRLLRKWDSKMYECAKNLEFEQAAQIRDAMKQFKQAYFD